MIDIREHGGIFSGKAKLELNAVKNSNIKWDFRGMFLGSAVNYYASVNSKNRVIATSDGYMVSIAKEGAKSSSGINSFNATGVGGVAVLNTEDVLFLSGSGNTYYPHMLKKNNGYTGPITTSPTFLLGVLFECIEFNNSIIITEQSRPNYLKFLDKGNGNNLFESNLAISGLDGGKYWQKRSELYIYKVYGNSLHLVNTSGQLVSTITIQTVNSSVKIVSGTVLFKDDYIFSLQRDIGTSGVYRAVKHDASGNIIEIKNIDTGDLGLPFPTEEIYMQHKDGTVILMCNNNYNTEKVVAIDLVKGKLINRKDFNNISGKLTDNIFNKIGDNLIYTTPESRMFLELPL